jgi:hypothetical protein
MEFLVGAALALLSGIVVAYPFLTARRSGAAESLAGDAPARFSAVPELESVYQAIRDLQWERQAGELPEDFYRQQVDACRRQAAILLRQQSQGQTADQALEQQVAWELAKLAGQADGGSSPPDDAHPPRDAMP